jgi:hypothetical protein
MMNALEQTQNVECGWELAEMQGGMEVFKRNRSVGGSKRQLWAVIGSSIFLFFPLLPGWQGIARLHLGVR